MNMETSSNGSAWPVGGSCFLLGVGAGLVAGLLLAQHSGKVTRRMIGRKVREGETWVKDQVQAAEDYAAGYGMEMRDRVAGVAEKIARE